MVPHPNANNIAKCLGMEYSHICVCISPEDICGIVCAYVNKVKVVIGFIETYESQIVDLTKEQTKSVEDLGLIIDSTMTSRLKSVVRPSLGVCPYKNGNDNEYYWNTPPNGKGIIFIIDNNNVIVIGAAASQQDRMGSVFTESQLKIIDIYSLKVKIDYDDV